MTEDMYLSFAIELFENGTWSKDVFIKRITLYAKENNMDMSAIDEIVNRLTKKEEYTIDEKRRFLSFVTISGDELKYGVAALNMSDEMVEKFYEMEKGTLSKDKFEEFHNIAASNSVVEEEVIQDEIIEEKVPEILIEEEPGVEEVIIDNYTKLFGNKSINDIIVGNYTMNDILGSSDSEKDARFNYLVQNVKSEDLRDVANSLIRVMDPSYCLNFTIEWEKFHKNEMNYLDENKEDVASNKVDTNEKDEENKEDTGVVVPEIDFDSFGMPETEEEFKKQAENITKTEEDSSVKEVSVSKERLERLKKSKGKVINYFLKTAIVVGAVTLLNPSSTITLVGGYLVFANMIKKGKFNPENAVGKAIKGAVEKVMYIGMNKEEIENERGKSR